MRVARIAAVFLVAFVLATMSPALAKSKHVKLSEVEEGHGFCPTRALVLGGVAVRAGRCYVLAVLRDTRGAFFAFMDPAVRIPPGQLVRLDTPVGRKLRGRIIYLVPMSLSPQIVLIPVNTIQLIRLREEDEEEEDEDEDEGKRNVRVVSSSFTLILSSMPIPDVTVTIVVNF